MSHTTPTPLFTPASPLRARLLLAGLLCASGLASAQTPAPAASPAARTVISSAEQLPRRTIKLERLPSAYLAAPLPEVLALAKPLEAQAQADLQRYEIRDAATLRSYYGMLLSVAQLKSDWAAVPGLVQQLRAQQEKPGPRAVTGLSAELIAQMKREGRDAAWLQAELTRRLRALNWAEAGDTVKGLKGQLELFNPELVRGSFEQQLDVMARNAQMDVPEAVGAMVLGARAQLEFLPPLRPALIAALQTVIDERQAAQGQAKPDVWTPRQFAIAPDARASVVNIAVWDSGVDLKLFKPTQPAGLAFEDDGRPAQSLLRPLGEAQARWPQLSAQVKGSMDLRAALDTEDARRLKQTIAALKADQAKAFQEDMGLAGLYIHGTHVAGIATDGNPFARVFAGTMLWSHKLEPFVPSEARSQRTAQAYREMVQAFRTAKVRVVNMSWRYGASALEAALSYHNQGGSPEERKQLARKLFAIERDALREAMAGAPEILFVAGAGNEDNNADFEEYIPAGLSLPNLITVGAVDKAGDETSFSTFGKTVVVHANGFEVESFFPGGERAKLSGTSMASPQIANQAAKLFALNDKLTVAQVKQAILESADARGRVRLANPRASAERLGLKP